MYTRRKTTGHGPKGYWVFDYFRCNLSARAVDRFSSLPYSPVRSAWSTGGRVPVRRFCVRNKMSRPNSRLRPTPVLTTPPSGESRAPAPRRGCNANEKLVQKRRPKSALFRIASRIIRVRVRTRRVITRIAYAKFPPHPRPPPDGSSPNKLTRTKKNVTRSFSYVY